MLAPNAKLRSLVVPQGPPKEEEAASVAAAGPCEGEIPQARPGRISWARLLKRVSDIDMQHRPDCGAGELRPAIGSPIGHTIPSGINIIIMIDN